MRFKTFYIKLISNDIYNFNISWALNNPYRVVRIQYEKQAFHISKDKVF
jgi:hypothetical protein